jgi:hypothetical protein
LVTFLISVNPTFWEVLVAPIAPELKATVYSVRAENDAGAFGDTLSSDGSIADGLADGRRDGGEESQDLLADSMKQGHRLQVTPDNWVVCRGNPFADFLAESRLDIRILA